MSKYSSKSVFGDKEVKVTEPTGNSNYKAMIPPTEKVGENGLKITGFVDGVTVVDWKFDAEKHQVVITFGTEGGETIRHWVTDPDFDGRITKQEEESKREMMAGFTLKELKGVVSKSVYSSAVNNAILGLGAEWGFDDYAKVLGELVMGDEHKTRNENSLKLVFKEGTGEKPAYKVGKTPYFGTTGDEQYGAKFITDKGEWNDVVDFEYIEKIPDFNNEDSIDDIFSGSSEIDLL